MSNHSESKIAESSGGPPRPPKSRWPAEKVDIATASDALGRLSFESVWNLELSAIQRRRELLDLVDDNPLCSRAGQEMPASVPTEAARTKLADLCPTIGLALSGGGIRSASFNLGVIQAFAEQKLIGNLDYLSTVSGGGYIGSWLTSWIYRDGDVANVENLLSPDRRVNALAGRQFVDPRRQDVDEKVCSQVLPDVVLEKEPEPLVHLRANSNYLALRPGIFTPDSWALIAIYLRNIFLNLLVVIPTITALILTVIGLSDWYRPGAIQYPLMLPALAIVLTLFVVAGVSKSLGAVRTELDSRRNAMKTRQNPRGSQWWDQYFGWVVLATVFVAYLLSLDLLNSESYFVYLTASLFNPFQFDNPSLNEALGCGLTLGILQMLLLNYASLGDLLTGKRRGNYVLWPLSGLIAGMVLGVLTYLVRVLLRSDNLDWFKQYSISPLELQALFSVPLLLTGFFIAQTIQVGVLGRLEAAEVREKWSAFQARCFMGGLVWFILVLHVYFISHIIHFGRQSIIPSNLSIAAIAGWLFTTVSSLLTAQNSSSVGQTVNGNKWRWPDLVIMAGPPLFFSGLLAILAKALSLLIVNDQFAGMSLWVAAGLMLLFAVVVGGFVDINIFSLQEMYEARLVRCFLGAARRDNRPPRGAPFRTRESLRRPDPITSMAPNDDFAFEELETRLPPKPEPGEKSAAKQKPPYTGPLHLINTTVNLTRDIDLQRQERKADSFVLSPVACGNPSLKYRLTGKQVDGQEGYAGGIELGNAVALSGAALSPNMGYYSSPAVTALLTLFNVRLGNWLGNPATESWRNSGPRMGWYHLLKEMMGLTDSSSEYVYISDGGHFDNLGVYELLRRRVRYIFASDAGADPKGSCNELGMIIRKAFVDFGIVIEIDVNELAIDPTTHTSKSNYAIGKINYPQRTLADGTLLDACEGTLIYIKMTRVGKEPTDIETYRLQHPEFPHQSTIYQFYSESQFESYRHLGYHIGSQLLSGNQSDYRKGHPRYKPEVTRKWPQLVRYLCYLKAIGSVIAPKDWDDKAGEYDDKFAALMSRLYTRRDLKKLRAEIEKITELLEICEEIYHYGSDDCREDPCSLQKKQEYEQLLLGKKELQNQLIRMHLNYRDAGELEQEEAWMIEAITLINNLMVALKWENYESTLRTEWMRVLRQWMCTSTFQKMWQTLKNSYCTERQQFVDDLLNDKEWVNVCIQPGHRTSAPSALKPNT